MSPSAAPTLRRSPRLTVKARAKLVAARVAYEKAYADFEAVSAESRATLAAYLRNEITSSQYMAFHDHTYDAIGYILKVATYAYDAAEDEYKKRVGNNKLHICRQIANQPIYEALLKQIEAGKTAWERPARIVRGFTESLLVNDELIWDGEVYERMGSREAVEFIDSVIGKLKR